MMNLFYKFSKSYIWIGIVTFLFALFVTLFVRYVFFPIVMPGAIDPQGLLLHTDSISYHRMATAIAAEIHRSGWKAWDLNPMDNVMIGFLSALYAIFVPKAWVVIPFGALAHALAVVLLTRLARAFTSDPRWALVAALPYALFPSAAFWYTQILKDGYFNVGILLYLVGWVVLLEFGSAGNSGLRKILASVVLIGTGYTLQGLVRPYTMSIVLVVSLGMFVIVTAAAWYRRHRGEISTRRGASLVLIAFLCVAGQVYLKVDFGYRFTSEASVELLVRGDQAERAYWQMTPGLPGWLETRLASLSGVRNAYIRGRPDAKSTIDRDVRFTRAADIVAYVPRAIQIAFLAPFPDQWLGQGSTAATTVMRRVSMLEMLVTYGLLLFLPAAVYFWFGRAVFWIAVVYPGVMMTVYALATPNMGTFYRVRYAYLMIFIALAIVAMGKVISRLRGVHNTGIVDENDGGAPAVSRG